MATAKPIHDSEPAVESQRLIAGRFCLRTQIGQGRLGDIYEAEDMGRRELGIAEHAAVQVLSETIAQNNGLFDKLELGYTVLRSAAHPGIVSYLDVGRENRCGYIVMELLKGASMRSVLENDPTLPLDEVVPILRVLGDALQFLHSKSIVHGKVNAENVFVTFDLDVRLLDVVPLASSDTVLRGVAERELLNRASVQDDVFALACLAYEMLTGKHPFNFQSLPDVMKAGLQPTRINSLPEDQWQALRRTLVPNGEDGIRTVVEFLHEFGVSGTERLRDLKEEDAPTSQIADPIPPAFVYESEPPHKPPRKGRLRLATLLLTLAGLGAWYVYGEPSNRLAAFLESTPALSSLVDRQLLAAAPIPADMSEAPDNEPAQDVGKPVSDDAEIADIEPGEPPQATAPEPAETDYAFEESVLTVSERDAAAHVAVLLPKSRTDDVSWWTSAHAAIADQDYIVLEGRLSGSGTRDEITTLHIPLVDDNQSERLEDFFVHLGRHSESEGRLVPIDTLRVDIVDDD